MHRFGFGPTKLSVFACAAVQRCSVDRNLFTIGIMKSVWAFCGWGFSGVFIVDLYLYVLLWLLLGVFAAA